MATPLTRDSVLAAARELIRDEGLESLSLRRLATVLGVTAPALYAHIGSKQGLLQGVAEGEFGSLMERFRAVTEATSDPMEQIRGLSHAYVDYARANPQLFRTIFLFRPELTAAPRGDELPLATAVFEFASAPVDDAIARGLIRRGDPLMTALTLWTAVHGVVTVILAGPEFGTDTEDALLDSVVDTLL
ncbi:MAG: TetR/AcrR family transcriptional regulator, partial [Acidimicrobiia bacterium]|nr:TetR/AcrR family transcriptional regulator [Acidimicrobiia bacterium]